MAAPMDPGEFRALATRLREEDRHDELKGVLVRVGRAALQGGLGPDTLAGLAQVLNEHQEFGYARRLMRRAREATQDPERKRALQRREALFTYKDLELPAGPRFDRALEILDEGILLKECEDADWLGLAGAILKRRWQVDGSSDDLDQARWCYLRGWELEDDPERCYPGINAAYVLDLLASIRQERAVVPTPEPDALRAQADAIRAEVARLMQELVKQGKSHWWHAMTLVEAHFGLGQIDQALEALKLEVAEDYRPEWWLESTATQLLSLAQLRGLETAGAPVLRELVPDAAIDPAQLATGKVGLALSGGGFRASLFHVGGAREARRARPAAARRGPVMRLGRVDRRRLLLPQAPRAAAADGGRRDRAGGLRRARRRAGRGAAGRRPGQPARPPDQPLRRELAHAALGRLLAY
jgi:Tetratricopeptide Repeats-Sensor